MGRLSSMQKLVTLRTPDSRLWRLRQSRKVFGCDRSGDVTIYEEAAVFGARI